MDDLNSKFNSIGITRNYADMELSDLNVDIQGWGSEHPIFEHVIGHYKPALVIEVGTWKGASVLNMLSLARSLQLNTQFICVDTWLGSNKTLWFDADYRKSLMLKNGYPTMFRQFIRNIIEYKAESAIFPLPMTSTAAAYTLRDLNIVADAIYIDAGHEEEEVLTDLNLFYDRLRPGGVMFGDDYVKYWIGVVRAVDRFCADRGIPLQAANKKWLVEK